MRFFPPEDTDKRGRKYLRLTVVTKRGLNELKYGEKNENVRKLQDARLYVTLDHWRTERSKVVGFLATVHPRYTWKPDLKRQLKVVLM